MVLPAVEISIGRKARRLHINSIQRAAEILMSDAWPVHGPQCERAAVKLIQGRVARLTAKAARRDVVGRAVLQKDCMPALRAASGRVGGHDVRSIIWPPCEMSHRRPTEELLTLAQPSSPEGFLGDPTDNPSFGRAFFLQRGWRSTAR
jgi:hypothetical protein